VVELVQPTGTEVTIAFDGGACTADEDEPADEVTPEGWTAGG
jgi:hypothetical protein